MVTRGFTGRGSGGDQSSRIPPGQHLVEDFPVLSAGPTPHVKPSDWKFTVKVGPKPVKVWSWSEFNALPKTKVTKDIHCVTSWSKLDTAWEGVLVEDILADAGLDPPTDFVLAHCYDKYSTNVPLADLLSGKAMVALTYGGKPLSRDHGGPARLLVPHLLLEVRQMGECAAIHDARRAGILGGAWLPYLRRSVARAALHQ